MSKKQKKQKKVMIDDDKAILEECVKIQVYQVFVERCFDKEKWTSVEIVLGGVEKTMIDFHRGGIDSLDKQGAIDLMQEVMYDLEQQVESTDPVACRAYGYLRVAIGIDAIITIDGKKYPAGIFK